MKTATRPLEKTTILFVSIFLFYPALGIKSRVRTAVAGQRLGRAAVMAARNFRAKASWPAGNLVTSAMTAPDREA